MMGTGLGVQVDAHRAGPDFLGADAGIVYGGLAVHPRCLQECGSSDEPGITRTPSYFHFGSCWWSCVWVMAIPLRDLRPAHQFMGAISARAVNG